MSDVLSDIGMRLKRWRKENRFTQAETAKLLEMGSTPKVVEKVRKDKKRRGSACQRQGKFLKQNL